MTDSGIIGIILIVVNVFFSYKGFTNTHFFNDYKFVVSKILVNKDYKRLITSGFLHVGWSHLIFNMISLYLFSGAIESVIGGTKFLIIYFASLIGGDLLSLIIHKRHSDYSAVGASGAICGVIFASIALFPGMSIGFFLIPFSIPAWIYGIIYVLFSMYGIRSKKDNIGHEAHLGGALIGMLIALLMVPEALFENYFTILVIVVPTIAFIFMIILKPQLLLVDNFFYKAHHDFYSIDHRYNAEKRNKQKEIDRLLDKINKNGISSLSKAEKDRLRDFSRDIR